jgi:hypothetical protein
MANDHTIDPIAHCYSPTPWAEAPPDCPDGSTPRRGMGAQDTDRIARSIVGQAIPDH